MKYRQKILMLILISCLVLTKDIFAQNRNGYGKPLATYKTLEGFTITSYSKKWDTPLKLKEIGSELLSNLYGEEISYLKNIYVYPDSPDGVLAYTHYDLRRDSRGSYIYKDNAYIEIFDADQYNNIADMAWVLSHEYGHHFTTYHLLKKENKFFDEWRSTGYAKARNISGDPRISYQINSIGNLYRWDIMEIAAEDYVQLFGSPNAKKSIIYKDIQQRIHGNVLTGLNYTPGFNMKPQGNLELPLAADVKGLEQYWRNLAGVSKSTSKPIPIKPQLRIVSKKEVVAGYHQYRLEWDKIPGDLKYEYTLISYPDGGYIFPSPIKTVSSNEEPYAIVGNALKTDLKTGIQQLVLDDYKGRYTFNLYIKDANNKIYSSVPLNVNFNYPVIINNGIYKDMHPTDWSYDAIKQINELNIMVGSPDNYFYPLKGVTYIEFMTIMDRYIGGNAEWLNIHQDELNALEAKKHISRDDASLLLYQYMESKESTIQEKNESVSFKDEANIIRKKEVNYLYKKGIIEGSNGYYYPKNNISRQELASILVRLLKHQ